MQWQTPTTKEELHATLQDIFYYYRIRKQEWEGVELLPLELQRLQFSQLSETTLLEKATQLVLPETEKEEYFSLQDLKDKVNKINTQKIKLEQDKQTAIEKLNEQYQQVTENVYKEISNRGLTNSTVIVDKINQINGQKTEKIAQLTLSFDAKIADLDGQLTAVNERIESTKAFYANLLDKRAKAKALELKEEQDKTEREVSKYNVSLDEKETRYQNDLTRQKMDLHLKYLELSSNFFSKDQLIDMGYYEAVLSCACSYYNTLDPLTAYQEISQDKTVMIYLDDYYNVAVVLYQTKTNI